jgi:hypothetical protein
MIEHGAAHGLKWARAIVVLTSNVGARHAVQLGQEVRLVRATGFWGSALLHVRRDMGLHPHRYGAASATSAGTIVMNRLLTCDSRLFQAEPSTRNARIRELVEADWRQRCVQGEDDLVTQARMLKLVRQSVLCSLSAALSSVLAAVLFLSWRALEKFVMSRGCA